MLCRAAPAIRFLTAIRCHRVQARRGFVQDKYVRLVQHGLGEKQPLPHPPESAPAGLFFTSSSSKSRSSFAIRASARSGFMPRREAM